MIYPGHIEQKSGKHYEIVSPVVLHCHRLIAALVVEYIKISPRTAGARVENPVLLDASRLILIELVSPVPCYAVVRDHFHHQVSRAAQACLGEAIEMLSSHKEQVRFPCGALGYCTHFER